MPIEVGIWRINGGPRKVAFSALESESRLEKVLEQDISILSPDLMLIGRQVPTAHGKFIDLLAMDADGSLSVIELKRNRTPREVVAQVLDYGSWVQGLSYGEITDIYTERNNGKEFEQGFDEAFGISPPEKLNESLQLIVVAAELDNASERIISYLSDNFGVPINAVFFRYFKDEENEYLTRTWLIDPTVVEAKSSKSSTQKQKEAWNGRDFYVSFGDDPRRSWEDAVEYGYISAGGGRWYSRTLHKLTPGARVFVCMPGTGYVGVGIVKGDAKPLKEFAVETPEGEKPIVEVATKAPKMTVGMDDPERSEYFVAVDWLNTLTREEAIWETGMYANQNTVTKLRNQFTLERLVERFGLDQE